MPHVPSRRLRFPTTVDPPRAVRPCARGLLYLITIQLSPYNDFLVGEIALYVIALAGLSLLTGVNGQISLGNGAFMAVGAYTVALLMTHTQLNFFVELLAAIGAAAVLGLAIAIPATRLKGPYLAGMTLLLALALLPSPQVDQRLRRRPGSHHHRADGAGNHQSRAMAGLDRNRRCPADPAAAGQSAQQSLRPLLRAVRDDGSRHLWPASTWRGPR